MYLLVFVSGFAVAESTHVNNQRGWKMIIHEIRRLIDQGEYLAAKRACQIALKDDSAILDNGLTQQLQDLVGWTERLGTSDQELGNWLDQSVSFWEQVLKTSPDDLETANARKVAMARRHHLLRKRHTARLYEEHKNGLGIAS